MSSLPAPVVRVATVHGAMYKMAKGAPTVGNLMGVTVINPATVSVHGLPDDIMRRLDEYKPQLELMRYVRRRTAKDNWSRAMRNSGYVHPSHGPHPSGGRTHGGDQASVHLDVRNIRETEWPVTNWGQVIDVTQGITGFLEWAGVPFREPGNQFANNSADLPVPSGRGGLSGILGRRFPYGRRFYPGYYKFRWSILDLSDDRRQRITGPLSDTVSITTEVFPFIPGQSFDPGTGVQYATATFDPRCQADLLRCWIGTSRLPR